MSIVFAIISAVSLLTALVLKRVSTRPVQRQQLRRPSVAYPIAADHYIALRGREFVPPQRPRSESLRETHRQLA